jgi:hypothetical protein
MMVSREPRLFERNNAYELELIPEKRQSCLLTSFPGSSGVRFGWWVDITLIGFNFNSEIQ